MDLSDGVKVPMRVIFATNDRGYRFLKVAVHTLVTHADPAKPYEICILEPKILHYWGGRKPWKFNHRPERLRYERAMRELGLLDGELEGSTFLKRLTLPFWDFSHEVMKRVINWRYQMLCAARLGATEMK